MGQEPAAGLQGNAYFRKLSRRHWRTEHIACGSQTADIIRAEVSAAGNPAAGVAPTTTLAANLSGLNVTVAFPGLYDAISRDMDYVQLKENQREFSFLDLPATTGVPALTLQLDDRILHDGERWRPTRIWNDLSVGCSRCVAELSDRG